MKDLRTMVVDDEPSSRQGLIKLLENIPGIKIVAEAHSSETFLENLDIYKPELVFMDIMLKNTNSLDMLINLRFKTNFIITTAYSQHALRGYECNVIDYLLKPVSELRLRKAVERVQQLLSSSDRQAPDCIYLKADGRYYKFGLDEILFVKGMENYVVVHTESQKLVCKTTMTSMMDLLPSTRFIQVHRSYIVNTSVVSVVEKLNLTIREHVIPISRERKQNVYQRLFNDQFPAFFD